MIKLNNLSKEFDAVKAVDNVSFSVGAGVICGYLGPNGAGKTTTVKMLTGMLEPDSGSAGVAGYSIDKEALEVKRKIGYVPESGALYQSLTPFEYLQFVGRLHDMEEQLIEERINTFLEFFGILDNMHKRMSAFSKGMRQKVVIASALIHNPEIIFMDEPLNGLDANAAVMIKKLLKNLAKEGKTIFYCSHILEVVENLCDRVIIINRGKIVADGSVDELKEMTKRTSLEAVFSELTNEEDLGEIADAFSRSITTNENKQHE